MAARFRFQTSSGILKVRAAGFLDRKSVVQRMDAKERKALARTGGWARKFMRWGMRYKQGPGPVGRFPHAHVGHMRKLTEFWVEFHLGEVRLIVGPQYLPAPHKGVRFAGGVKTIPEVVNRGGTEIKRPRRRGLMRIRSGRKIVTKIAARPFTAITTTAAIPILKDNMRTIPL